VTAAWPGLAYPENPSKREGGKPAEINATQQVNFLSSNHLIFAYHRLSCMTQWRAIMGKRAAIYVRVSSDAGISGSKGRDGRPGLDTMLRDASKRRFDVVMAWAIDRLGRSLIDLLGTIQTLEACGVDLYLDQQNIDTTTPAGRLMFQVTGAFAEFERGMIRQRIHAGLKRAVEAGKTLGRPRISPAIEKRIQDRLRAGIGIIKVARELGVGNGTVQRIAGEMNRPFVAA
jgi:DNA invertase Pin-like site-specific DNA recombinase